MITNVGKITTRFDNQIPLQQMIINVAIKKALADIYGLLTKTEEDYYEYQLKADDMFNGLEQFQKLFPTEYKFCYPTPEELLEAKKEVDEID